MTAKQSANKIDVAGFVKANYTPYTGDASFLAEPTNRTKVLRVQMEDLFAQERR